MSIAMQHSFTRKGLDGIKASDAYMRTLPAHQQKIAKAVWTLARSARSDWQEGIKWGNPTLWITKKPIVAIFAYEGKDYVNVWFFHGTKLKDPKKRLEGTGKGLRHIKVHSVQEIDTKYFLNLIWQSIVLDAKSNGSVSASF